MQFFVQRSFFIDFSIRARRFGQKMGFCISVREDRIILDTHIHAKRGRRGRSLTKMHTSYLFTNTLVFDFFTVITIVLLLVHKTHILLPSVA